MANLLDPAGGLAGKAIIYSRLKEGGGIHTIQHLLEANGFVRWTGEGTTGTTPREKCFAIYSGDVPLSSDREVDRTTILAAFDEFDPVRGRTDRGFGVLLITTAGAEGVNTSSVTQVHVMEPFWHNVRLEQVVGRARRARSHVDWPHGEPRIDVFVYVATTDGLGGTTDSQMWERARRKNRDSARVYGRGIEPAAIEGITAGRNLDEVFAIRRARDRRTARFELELLLDPGAIRTAADYRRLRRRAIGVSHSSDCSFLAPRFDRRRNVSDLARFVRAEDRLEAAPWLLPIADARVRMGFPNLVGINSAATRAHVVQYGNMVFHGEQRMGDTSAALISEAHRLVKTRWPVRRDDDDDDEPAPTISRRKFLDDLYDADDGPGVRGLLAHADAGTSDTTQRECLVAPLRLLFPPRSRTTGDGAGGGGGNNHDESRLVTFRSPAHVVLRNATHRGEPARNLLRPAPDGTREVDVWGVRGAMTPGPRTQPAGNGEQQVGRGTSRCARCGDMSRTVPCSANARQYEPVRECKKYAGTKGEFDELVAATRESVYYPPTHEGVRPELRGERLLVTGLARVAPGAAPPRDRRRFHARAPSRRARVSVRPAEASRVRPRRGACVPARGAGALQLGHPRRGVALRRPVVGAAGAVGARGDRRGDRGQPPPRSDAGRPTSPRRPVPVPRSRRRPRPAQPPGVARGARPRAPGRRLSGGDVRSKPGHDDGGACDTRRRHHRHHRHHGGGDRTRGWATARSAWGGPGPSSRSTTSRSLTRTMRTTRYPRRRWPWRRPARVVVVVRRRRPKSPCSRASAAPSSPASARPTSAASPGARRTPRLRVFPRP